MIDIQLSKATLVVKGDSLRRVMNFHVGLTNLSIMRVSVKIRQGILAQQFKLSRLFFSCY